MTETRMQGVLFDMDGVILDTEKIWAECWQELGAVWQLPDVMEVCHASIGVTNEASAEIFNHRYGRIVSYNDFADEMRKLFQVKTRDGIPLKPGVCETLRQLHDRGIPMALASSTRSGTVRSQLEPMGIYGLFDAVIGGEQAKRSKPAPDIFLAAAEALSLPPEACWVVEDSYNGVRAGHAAGCRVLMVPDLLMPTEEIRRLCWAVCEDLPAAARELRFE